MNISRLVTGLRPFRDEPHSKLGRKGTPFVLILKDVRVEPDWRPGEETNPCAACGTTNKFSIGSPVHYLDERIGLALMLVEFAVFAGMSVLGFFGGWRTGWLISSGQAHSVISRGPSA